MAEQPQQVLAGRAKPVGAFDLFGALNTLKKGAMGALAGGLSGGGLGGALMGGLQGVMSSRKKRTSQAPGVAASSKSYRANLKRRSAAGDAAAIAILKKRAAKRKAKPRKRKKKIKLCRKWRKLGALKYQFGDRICVYTNSVRCADRKIRFTRSEEEEKKKEKLSVSEEAVDSLVVSRLPDGIYPLKGVHYDGRPCRYAKVVGGKVTYMPTVRGARTAIYAAGVMGDQPALIELNQFSAVQNYNPNEYAKTYQVGDKKVKIACATIDEDLVVQPAPIPDDISEVMSTMDVLANANPEAFSRMPNSLCYTIYDGALMDEDSTSVTGATFVFLTRGETGGRAVTGVSGFRTSPGVDSMGFPYPSLSLGELPLKSQIRSQRFRVKGLIAVSDESVKGVISVQSYEKLYKLTHSEPLLVQPESLSQVRASRGSTRKVESKRGEYQGTRKRKINGYRRKSRY